MAASWPPPTQRCTRRPWRRCKASSSFLNLSAQPDSGVPASPSRHRDARTKKLFLIWARGFFTSPSHHSHPPVFQNPSLRAKRSNPEPNQQTTQNARTKPPNIPSTRLSLTKVFWFFFSKKNRPQRHHHPLHRPPTAAGLCLSALCKPNRPQRRRHQHLRPRRLRQPEPLHSPRHRAGQHFPRLAKPVQTLRHGHHHRLC